MTKRIPAHMAETKLERVALRWLNQQGAAYRNGAVGAYADLMQGGCSSGIVGKLVLYSDTLKFYKRHQSEIDQMLQELLEDVGGTPDELFKRAGWDETDPLARGETNRNILAWFGFEEAARRVMERFCPSRA